MADFSSESLDLQKKVKEEDDNIKPMKEFESPEKLYDELIASVRKYHPSTDISLIEKAYHVARDAHEGQASVAPRPYLWITIAKTRFALKSSASLIRMGLI